MPTVGADLVEILPIEEEAILRAVVVGMGSMGRLHALEYLHMEDVALVGLVESDRRRHSELVGEYGVPVFAGPEQVLDRTDIVSVCTPDHLHLETVGPWLAAGRRVLLEKPMATSFQDAKKILAMRADENALMIGQILRFDPRVIRCRDLVLSGQLGDIWHIEVWRSTCRSVAATPALRTSVGWFLGIHDVDLVWYVTGLEVASVSAIGKSFQSGYADVVYALVRYRGSAIGTMHITWTIPDGRPNRGPAGLRVTGSEGSVEIDLGHIDLTYARKDRATNLDTRFGPSRSHVGVSNIGSEIRAFVDAARRGLPSPIPGEDGLAAVRIVELIHRSIELDGARVDAENRS
jgi:predicted dehydrogenase